MLKIYQMVFLCKVKKNERSVVSWDDFSWNGGGNLTQNSYKPSEDLIDTALKREPYRFSCSARFFGTHRNTHTHTKILLLYYEDIIIGCGIQETFLLHILIFPTFMIPPDTFMYLARSQGIGHRI